MKLTEPIGIQTPVDKWVVNPMKRFVGNSSTSGMVLFGSALVAMIWANSPWADTYHHLWETEFSIGFGDKILSKNLHHWINDGLMAIFFFVVGLELKREIIAGEFSNPRNAILPIGAAIGGMIMPALIYTLFNKGGDTMAGWGIPMATDIAFALGVLYLLGDKVPVSLKLFLTALAIADDLGAVLVIAFFYTSHIDVYSLMAGAAFMIVLISANKFGVRNVFFYAIMGIGGLWLAFLMSGVHATIAAVLAAFTIPVKVKVEEQEYADRVEQLMVAFRQADPNGLPTVTNEQLHILEQIRDLSKKALTPLQRLEHGMHPLVLYIIMPIFALSNAGVELSKNSLTMLSSPVSIGIISGLLLGKVLGVVGTVWLILKLKWASLPDGMTKTMVLGLGFLAAIGFTMSLFISSLAFSNDTYIIQAKLGVLFASIIASILGFLIINKQLK